MLSNPIAFSLKLYYTSFFLCISFVNYSQSYRNENKFVKEIVVVESTGSFSKDTLLIKKYNTLARKFLYEDGLLSINYAKKALALSQNAKWDKGKIMTYNLLGAFYFNDGGYDVLREISNESYNLAIKHNLPLYRAYAERSLGEISSEYREGDRAKKFFESAMKTFVALKADSAQALCLESMANFYRENREFDKALEHYDLAYEAYNQLNNTYGMGSVLGSKGYLYVRMGDNNKGLQILLKALKLQESINNRYGILNVLNDLNNVHFKLKEYDLAIEESKRALDLAIKYHSGQHINWALTCMANSYKMKNNLPEAIKYMEQINFNRRLMHEEQVERRFTMSQLIFENKQLDLEIQQNIISKQQSIQMFLLGILVLIILFSLFLWRTNIRLRKKNIEIQSALIRGQTMERKRVAAELHDNLGGTLASLNWYLYGIDKKILPPDERKIYESVQQMVSKAYRELRSLSHNLMPDELDEHGLVVTIDHLLEKLNVNNQIKFNFEVNGLHERLQSRIEFELYSIILELTNNILKHSNASQANIELKKDDKQISVSVIDNGVGLTRKDASGVGLKNVRTRVESLSGDLKILKSKGTSILIQIPANIKL